MGEMPQSSGSHLTVVSSVRCLECGAIYAKPAGPGTVRSNPGCPECGYLGWVGVPGRSERGGAETDERNGHGAPNGSRPSDARTA